MKNRMLPFGILAIAMLFIACGQVDHKQMEDLAMEEKVQLEIDAGARLDTIVTFDPVTGLQTLEILKSKEGRGATERVRNLQMTGIDTVVTFDPVTYEEQVTIVNHDTGETTTQ